MAVSAKTALAQPARLEHRDEKGYGPERLFLAFLRLDPSSLSLLAPPPKSSVLFSTYVLVNDFGVNCYFQLNTLSLHIYIYFPSDPFPRPLVPTLLCSFFCCSSPRRGRCDVPLHLFSPRATAVVVPSSVSSLDSADFDELKELYNMERSHIPHRNDGPRSDYYDPLRDGNRESNRQ